MEPTERELKDKLSAGPLSRNGFDEQLQRRIYERIASPPYLKRMNRPPLIAGIGAAAIALALLLPNEWVSPLKHNKAEPLSSVSPDRAAQTASSPDGLKTASMPELNSAMLIGLRTDHPAAGGKPAYSTYRTQLITENNGKLQAVAEGTGILMPYMQNFWRIQPQLNAGIDKTTSLLLTASRANAADPAVSAQASVPDQMPAREEKLLFAGNRYVAVDLQSVVRENGKDVRSSYAWVKDITQLASGEHAADPAKEPHIGLRDLLGSETIPSSAGANLLNAIGAGESWTITRLPGHWAAMQATYDKSSADGTTGYKLKEVASALPDSVVSHDKLNVEWEDIRRTQPNATDAFESPDDDMAAVVTQGALKVYPVTHEQLMTDYALTFPLGPNETVVMSQWATDGYVAQWILKAKALLKPQG